MRDKNVSSPIVIDNYNKPTGIITERHLVRKVCVNDASSSNMLIRNSFNGLGKIFNPKSCFN